MPAESPLPETQRCLICITGANGWLGLNLVEALTQGLPELNGVYRPEDWSLRALILPGSDRTALQALNPQLSIVEGDLRNPVDSRRFLEGCEGAIVIHTAGIIHPRRVHEFYDINLEGTRNLLQSAVENRVARAVVVSSNSPCGCNPHPEHRFDERSPFRPYMHYGRSKMKMELMVRELASQSGLETVIIRAPWFYGPHQPPRQGLFFRMIRDGKAPIVGDGQNFRSMAYTGNLAQGLILAATSAKAAGETYWIADEQPYTMNEIIDTIERLLETEFGQQCAHRRMRLPGLASEVAYAMDKAIQSLGLYQQKIHVLSEMNKSIACVTDKAQKELGYRPTVDLEEGMRRSLRWCEAQGIPL
jgi:nucleoside-diphosphate-sugar epimerase